MTQDRVVLLIDADNVSVDVMEQAVDKLIDEYGALHVRRAYCTAESAVKHQSTFKRLLIKPMVNLATGKNSTDIALAVDAIYLVLSNRPDVVAIASSDSDFAPLVSRLREQGCRVVGLGQNGKTGEDTQAVYDAFTVLTHRKAGAASPASSKRSSARKTSARAAPRAAAIEAPAPARTAAKASAKTAGPAALAGSSAATPAPAPARKTARRKAPAKKAAAAAPAAPRASVLPDTVQQILEHVPELASGQKVELRLASARLRDAGLLSKGGSCTKLIGQFSRHFELLPEGQPNHVRLRAAT